jgi:CelD/BcsL family acetyltransferase involved in cellulose biosynthesis
MARCAVKLELIEPDRVPWERLDQFEDRLVYQTREWLDFIARTQGAKPVVAALNDGGATVGYFTGLVSRRFGLRILGSPMPGWTTGFIGFNLEPGVARPAAAEALVPFAFRSLRCAHLELRDRYLLEEDIAGLGFERTPWRGLEIDLRPSEDEIWASVKGSVRTAIRKSEKLGVTIEEASDLGFADDLYAQVREVFARLSLAPPWGVDRIRELIRTVHPSGRLLLLRARGPEGDCIATAVFPGMNRTMHFLSAGSRRQYQHLAPNEALVWHAIRHWKARGAEVCDFGGFLDYKRKWRPDEVQVPFLRKSRFRAVAVMRDAAKRAHDARQGLRGWLRGGRVDEVSGSFRTRLELLSTTVPARPRG